MVQRDALLPLRRPHQAVERGQITGQLTQRIAFILPLPESIVNVSGVGPRVHARGAVHGGGDVVGEKGADRRERGQRVSDDAVKHPSRRGVFVVEPRFDHLEPVAWEHARQEILQGLRGGVDVQRRPGLTRRGHHLVVLSKDPSVFGLKM